MSWKRKHAAEQKYSSDQPAAAAACPVARLLVQHK
jgi:hypothetical protein